MGQYTEGYLQVILKGDKHLNEIEDIFSFDNIESEFVKAEGEGNVTDINCFSSNHNGVEFTYYELNLNSGRKPNAEWQLEFLITLLEPIKDSINDVTTEINVSPRRYFNLDNGDDIDEFFTQVKTNI